MSVLVTGVWSEVKRLEMVVHLADILADEPARSHAERVQKWCLVTCRHWRYLLALMDLQYKSICVIFRRVEQMTWCYVLVEVLEGRITHTTVAQETGVHILAYVKRLSHFLILTKYFLCPTSTKHPWSFAKPNHVLFLLERNQVPKPNQSNGGHRAHGARGFVGGEAFGDAKGCDKTLLLVIFFYICAFSRPQ